ncbi:competence type IV pilus minor pilin ComGG [Pseudalkalibacillus berkeleyi]|uniref:Competence protein ComGG n=1 Tax=Pseudalkalibacillus berkeleyi TaxID=1069813 RepID=A0ABS9H221_9BACL|nr:competence type IV pilus minor pilin ComGG [Pseudalkalibacillus berkeleyi]MCF6137883.1 hypothetical protein [Pseudalkalibacillus berkeleyi]
MKQAGYMTALSVMLSFILVSVLVANIRILNSERALIETRMSWFQTNIMIQLAREELMDQLRANTLQSGDEGIFTYSNGKVSYYITEEQQGVFRIRFEAVGKRNGKGTSLLYYDYANQEVIQWVVV